MQIFADDHGMFCLVLHFLSPVATIRMKYNTAIQNVAIQKFEC